MLLGGDNTGGQGNGCFPERFESVPTAYPHDFILVLTENQELLMPKAIFINKKAVLVVE